VIRNECLRAAADGAGSREGSITFGIYTLIFEDTSLGTDLRIEILGDAPTAVEEVQQVLDIEAELENIVGILNLYAEVMLVAEVYAMNPRRINTVCLGILALMLAQVLVVVDVSHEAGSIVIGHETEVTIADLSIGRDVDSVILVTIVVHVIGEHVRVVVTTPPSLIYEGEVIAALVIVSQGCDEAVRSHILGIVQRNVVRAL